MLCHEALLLVLIGIDISNHSFESISARSVCATTRSVNPWAIALDGTANLLLPFQEVRREACLHTFLTEEKSEEAKA